MVNEVADLCFQHPVNGLRDQPDLAARVARRLVQRQPAAVAVLCVAVHLPPDPRLGLVAGVAIRVEAHHLWVGEHRRHEIEVIKCQLAEDEARRFEDDLHGCGSGVPRKSLSIVISRSAWTSCRDGQKKRTRFSSSTRIRMYFSYPSSYSRSTVTPCTNASGYDSTFGGTSRSVRVRTSNVPRRLSK